MVRTQAAGVHGPRLVSGLAVVFGVLAVTFAALAVRYTLVFLAVSALFGAAGYLTWYHASGRMAARLYRGVEQQAAAGVETGVGAGPREEWTGPRDGRTAAQAARERRQQAGAGQSRARQRAAHARNGQSRPSAKDYRLLGLEPGADGDAVQRAYREKVKEVHPDTESGNEAQFKRVKAAYERITDD